MGNVCGKGGGLDQGSPDDKKQNQRINQQLRTDKKRFDQEIKLLLLGAGESGKSTIAKQLKIMFMDGYTKEEAAGFRDIIHSNLVMGMRTLVLEAQKRGFTISDSLSGDVAAVTSDDLLFDQRLDAPIAQSINRLWQDDAIQQTFAQRHQFQLAESTAYYCDNVLRLSAADYTPTVDDILQARARTIGIREITFTSKGHTWRVVDVGGQRNERKKWIHCFQDVTSIIFCADASAYNMTLFEDSRVNRLLEALTLFEEICNCKYFDSTPLILFLNKSDLLKQKIAQYDIKEFFDDYNGGKNYENAVEWLTGRFVELNRVKIKTVYVHVTCATNTDNVRFVFAAVEDIIMYEKLQDLM